MMLFFSKQFGEVGMWGCWESHEHILQAVWLQFSHEARDVQVILLKKWNLNARRRMPFFFLNTEETFIPESKMMCLKRLSWNQEKSVVNFPQ